MRVAIIGSEGKMGGYHTKACIDLGHEVTRCDPKLVHAGMIYMAHYSDYKNISIDNIDAVIIATPTLTHYEIAKYFINCEGIQRVFIEKPMCENSIDAYMLVALARCKNVQLMVGHIERFNPVIYNSKVFRDISGIRDITTIRRGYAPEATSDIISDVMIHDIDTVNLILNYHNIPHHIYSMMKGKHYAQAVMNYWGVPVTHIVDRRSKHIIREIRIATYNHYIVLDLQNKKIMVYNDVDKNPYYVEQFYDDALRAELRAFFDGYDNAEQAYRNVKTCEDIIRGSMRWKTE